MLQQHSYFASDYFEEVLRSVVDNINLLYVATTRAKTVLEIACPVSKKTTTVYVNQLINDSLRSNTEFSVNGNKSKLSSFLNEDTQVFEVGDINEIITIVTESENNFKSISTSGKFSTFNTQILVADNSFGTISSETDKKIKYGILLHKILASVKYADEAEKVLQSFCTKEKISADEQKYLITMLNQLFQIPEVGEWFSRQNEVLTETAVIVKNGRFQRPDRVIFRDGKVVIIDYKTGLAELQKHKNQVKQYVNLLEEMNYTNIEGWLLYTDLMKIEKIE